MPSPQETLLRGLFSPVPTQTTFLSDGATQTSPTDTVASWSNWCSKVVPLLVVLRRPPEAVATQNVLGSASKTEMATMRPPMLAGPMQRHVSGLSQSAGSRPSADSGVGSAFLASSGALAA